MAPQLGKRKRVTREELERPSRSPSPSSGSDNEDMQELFRRAFEKKFKPLHVEPVQRKTPVVQDEGEEEDEDKDEDDQDDDEDAWSGLSDSEPAVQVVEYRDTTHDSPDEATLRAQKRAFMSSKPPTSSASTPTPHALSVKKKPSATDADDSTETANLKNDLALQKLLRDSHILSASSSGASTPTLHTTGALRHKSTDLHLQTLGARGSVFTQKKMPMAQRKHMVSKAKTDEEKRRADAREAGIILEKEKRERREVGKRERGVGGPSIGKFRGGTLTLSKSDVRGITGGPGSRGGKGGRGGRGGRGKPRR